MNRKTKIFNIDRSVFSLSSFLIISPFSLSIPSFQVFSHFSPYPSTLFPLHIIPFPLPSLSVPLLFPLLSLFLPPLFPLPSISLTSLFPLPSPSLPSPFSFSSLSLLLSLLFYLLSLPPPFPFHSLSLPLLSLIVPPAS